MLKLNICHIFHPYFFFRKSSLGTQICIPGEMGQVLGTIEGLACRQETGDVLRYVAKLCRQGRLGCMGETA